MSMVLASEARNLLPALQTDYGYALHNMKVVAITTAVHGEADDVIWFEHDKYCWKRQGITFDEVDIAGFNPDQLSHALAGYEAVYVMGGHTHYLLHHMKQCNFQNWLGSFLNRGGVYIGTCAGSMVMGPSISHVNMTPCRHQFNSEDNAGFGFFDKRIVCHSNWESEHISLVKRHRTLFGDWCKSEHPICVLNDYQGLFIENNRISIIS